MRIIRDVKAERALLVAAVERSAVAGKARILEAGCGQHWNLKPQDVVLHITGVDLDADAIKIRAEKHGDLDVAIIGDLHDVDLPDEEFDVVYCSYVLEHVHEAEKVLDRMIGALRPGGRLILRVPDGDSVFGWVAKHTPHRSHVWFKRYVERFPDAGKPGHAPYPTVYDAVVSEKGLRAWADRVGVTVEDAYATNHFIKKFGRLAPAVRLGLRGFAALSFGRLTAEWNNVGFVFRR